MRIRTAIYVLSLLAASSSVARAQSSDIRILPGDRGGIGAWLVAGPFPLPKGSANGLSYVPPGIQEGAIAAKAGTAIGGSPWRVAADSNGAIDLNRTFQTPNAKEQIAYAAGTLRVAKAGAYTCLFGIDDGGALFIDGKQIFARDEARPMRNDDDFARIDLAEGDHSVVLKLHQRDEAWAFKARCVDANFRPSPFVSFALPGTSETEGRQLAKTMVRTSFDRGTIDPITRSYRPEIRVRFPGGYPSGFPLDLRVAIDQSGISLFEAKADTLSFQSGVASEFVVSLPPLVANASDSAFNVQLGVNAETTRYVLPRSQALEAAFIRARNAIASRQKDPALAPGVESLAHLSNRFAKFLSNADTDAAALKEEAAELNALAADLERGVDPYAKKSGLMRRAIASPLDGGLSEFGLYVPPSYIADPSRPRPLIVALHGLNGMPMAMLRAFFGKDDDRPAAYKDRHSVPIGDIDAFVVAPYAYGNSMYRDLGEDDVMQVIEWVKRTYRIDDRRVSITGVSMGGIGAAWIPFRFPDLFAAAAPLCGYHSYFLRQDMRRKIQPWERFLAEERSNVEWAKNGSELPLYIVHGLKDQPVANSGVLIDAYTKMKYSIKAEHPDLGHNVWQQTYSNPETLKWLTSKMLPKGPREVRFRTAHARYGKSYWVSVDQLANPNEWGEITAAAVSQSSLRVQTKGIAEAHFDREPLFSAKVQVSIAVDGTDLTFLPNEPLAIHFTTRWEKGPATPSGTQKRGAISGPFRDIFHTPVVFVYGASDPAQSEVNRDVAQHFAQIRGGMPVAYPVISDVEFAQKKLQFERTHSLFLVGNAASNRVVREMESGFPIRVVGDAIATSKETFRGEEVGAAFIYPHPSNPARYVAVVEGATVLGTLRALSLPELMPDFMIYDRNVGSARGQQVLGPASALSAGFFTNEWKTP